MKLFTLSFIEQIHVEGDEACYDDNENRHNYDGEKLGDDKDGHDKVGYDYHYYGHKDGYEGDEACCDDNKDGDNCNEGKGKRRWRWI